MAEVLLRAAGVALRVQLLGIQTETDSRRVDVAIRSLAPAVDAFQDPCDRCGHSWSRDESVRVFEGVMFQRVCFTCFKGSEFLILVAAFKNSDPLKCCVMP